MTHIAELLGSMEEWTPVATHVLQDPPDFGLRHVSGALVHVWDCGKSWAVRTADDTPSMIARVKKLPPVSEAFPKYGAKAFLADLDGRYGAAARAGLAQVILEISLFALDQGIRARLYIARDNDTRYSEYAYRSDTNPMGDHIVLPTRLQRNLNACAGVLMLDPKLHCLTLGAGLGIDLPTTAHGVLDFLHQARQDG